MRAVDLVAHRLPDVVRDRIAEDLDASGIGVETPLLGFSMTKSVINALIGILTQQGLVTPSMPAPIPEWRGASDPRREIEVEHLMRMTSGLDLDETNSGFDPSSRMYLQDLLEHASGAAAGRAGLWSRA